MNEITFKKYVLTIFLAIVVTLSLFIIEPFLIGMISVSTSTADLSDYPEMFVTNQTFEGFIVVGENAQISDSLAAHEISSNMKIVSTETSDLAGDHWKAKGLEVANSDSSSVSGENLQDVSNYLDKSDLSALADGSYRTRGNSYLYKQYLYFDINDTATNELVKYAENDDDQEDLFFFIESGKNIAQYKLEFSPGAKSTIYDSTGSASSTGTVLRDFENTEISFLGKQYDLVLAQRAQQNNVKLILMSGAVTDSLLEGESQSYQLDEDNYEVKLIYVDGTSAKFSVNEELTAQLQVGETHRLNNGKEIGVSEVLYQDYAGGVHSANFFLGADKLILKDTDLSDSSSTDEIVLGGDTVDGTEVIITGSDDNSDVTINTLTISMTAEDDYYLKAGDKLSSVIDNPNMLFTGNWDLEFKGLDDVDSHQIKFDSSGSRQYELEFYDGSGNKVDLHLYYALDDTTISFGNSDQALHLKEGVAIQKNDYFVVTSGDSSFALEYRGADKTSEAGAKIRFKNLGNSESLEYSGGTSITIRLGGYSFLVENASSTLGDDYEIKVSLDGDSSVGSGDVNIKDKYKAQIAVGSIPASRLAAVASSTLTITTPDASDYNSQAPATIVLTIGATATDKVQISSFTVGGNSNPLVSKGTISMGYTSMGGEIKYSDDNPDSFTYNYPKTQRLALLYVTSKFNESVASFEPVNFVEAYKLDSEIGLGQDHLIIIGGPCVNSVAKALIEGDNCEEGFVKGQGRIKLYDVNGKTVLLVAGYNSADTEMAAEFLANRWEELSGNEVIIEGDNYLDAVVVR